MLKFENRAWEKAEHPRFVSNRVLLSKLHQLAEPKFKSVVFGISYHYVERAYYVQPNLYKKIEKIQGEQDPCYGGKMVFFETLYDALVWLETALGYEVK